MSLEIPDNSGMTFSVPVTALSGDTSMAARPTPAAKALVWNAAVDFNQKFNATMVVRVIANDGDPPDTDSDGSIDAAEIGNMTNLNNAGDSFRL